MEILEAEAPRVSTYHDKYSVAWAKMAAATDDLGRKAYAWKRRSFHIRLKQQMEDEWSKAQREAKTALDATAAKRAIEKGIKKAEEEHEERAKAATATKADSYATEDSRRRNKCIPRELADEKATPKRKRAKDDTESDEDDDSTLEEVEEDDDQQLLRPSRKVRRKDSPEKGLTGRRTTRSHTRKDTRGVIGKPRRSRRVRVQID